MKVISFFITAVSTYFWILKALGTIKSLPEKLATAHFLGLQGGSQDIPNFLCYHLQ